MRMVNEEVTFILKNADIYILDGVIMKIEITDKNKKMKNWLESFSVGERITPKQVIMMKSLDGTVVEEDGQCFLNNIG